MFVSITLNKKDYVSWVVLFHLNKILSEGAKKPY